MAISILTQPYFHNEEAAYGFVEARIWPKGPVCPHCGCVERISKMGGASTRIGSYKCYNCRKPFTVKIGTIFESSHIKLHIWLQAIFLISSSKKGVSANQLHRVLGITLKSAWFLSHRIREAMRAGNLSTPMGGEGKIVEADETYYGRVDKPRRRTTTTRGAPFIKKGKAANKRPIVALVERGGSVRTFHVAVADKASINKIIGENIARESRLHTDESRLYGDAHAMFASHETVHHTSGEYVRGDVHTNSAEGYFGVFKKGMRGVYQHCAEKHLHRYLAEFDFRFNNRVALGVHDGERATLAVKNAAGKRLTYRQPN